MPVLKIKKTDGTWQEVWGAIVDNSTASAPRLTTVTMLASAWEGSSNPYSQVVAVSGVNANSKLDLQPTAAQIVELQDAEISLMASNNNGIVTVYAIGGKPISDYTMNVLITEVVVV